MKKYRVTIEINELVEADNELQAIEIVEEMGHQYNVEEIIKCEHNKTEYIPYESDTNVAENYICLDCGINLPIPEEEEY